MPEGTEAHHRASEIAWALATIGLTCALAAVALKLWNADWHVPFSYAGDGNLNQLIVKGTLEHGWYQHNPSLGAPFGQVLYDFPVVSADSLQILLMKAIGIFTSDSALVMNAFFLLTFPLTAGLAYLVLRLFAISQPAACLAAVLFAIAPYHFISGEFHLFIAAYYAVPLGAGLVLAVLLDRAPLFGPPQLRRARIVRIALLLAACAVIGSAYAYYAAFTVALLATAALVRLIAGSRRAAAAGAVIALAIAAVMALNNLPNTIYRLDHGPNKSLQRHAFESELFALKLDDLVLPVPDHRIAPLRRLRARYAKDSPGPANVGDPQPLGIVGSLGLLGLLVVVLIGLARPGRRVDRRAQALAAAALAAILIATTGGVSGVFAYVISPQLRAWGRMAIFVEFFALAAVALAADRLALRRGARVALAVAGVVLAIGFLDQTNAGSAPDYTETAAAYRSDAAVVNAIEHILPRGAAVFELPFQPFPEPQPDWEPDVGPYDLARPYLHSNGLRWSYGLMKGRAGDWEDAVVQLPPALLARAVAAAGFAGIYIDRLGYADGGAYVVDALTREIGTRPIASPDGRALFFDLRSYATRERGRASTAQLAGLRSATLRPLTLGSEGLSGLRQDAQSRFQLMNAPAQLVVVNPNATRRRAVVTATLASARSTPAQVVIRYPDGSAHTLRVGPQGTTVDIPVDLPPGSSRIGLQVRGNPQLALPQTTRPYYLRVVDPLLVDNAFKPFGAMPPDRRAAAFLSPFGAI